MNKLSTILCFLLPLTLASGGPQEETQSSIQSKISSSQDKKTVRAMRTNEPVYIDGNLTENIWYQADQKFDFTQYQPQNGEIPNENTMFLVFYDENKHLEIVYLNFLVQSSIPIGRGISSSSALCVAIFKTLNDFFNIGYSDKHIALLAQKVERNYIGVSGGIMDQMVSSIGIHGKAFFLDCLTLKYELIDLPNNYCFELVDSEVQRDNRKSAYNERHDQLKKAEEILNVENLGSVKIDQLNKNKIDDLLIYKRALHVVTENQRTKDAKNFMLKQDMKQFGHLMNLSHLSYSKDFEASTEDVDLLTKRSIESGALGCRLTGGGFGGFTVSLIAKKDYEQWYNNMRKYYSKDKFFKV